VLGELKVKVWSDREIDPGEDWLPAIRTAISRSRVAILVISADFLNSPFIRSEEVPRFLERRQADGLIVIPVIARPCAWTAVDWLASIQCYPEGGRALSKGKKPQIDEDLAGLALKVKTLLAQPFALSSSQEDRPPYVGMRPFSDEDADLFYGREALTEHLLERYSKTSSTRRVDPC
jgi:hypothetical protein